MPELKALGNYDRCMKPFSWFQTNGGGGKFLQKNVQLIMDFPAEIMFGGLTFSLIQSEVYTGTLTLLVGVCRE